MSTIINASTSSGLIQTADTSGTLALQSNGTTQLTVSSTGVYGQLKYGTSQATTSGTAVDFVSIPSWVKRVTLLFKGVSTNGSSNILVQLGSGAGPTFTTTGYVSGSSTSSATNTTATTGFFALNSVGAGELYTGTVTIMNYANTDWVATNHVCNTGSGNTRIGGGYLALGATLTAVRITMANGTDTFDAGSINILFEG